MSDVLEQAKRILEARETATPAPLRAAGMGSEGYNLYAHLDGCSYKSHYDTLGFHGEIGRIHTGRDWKQLRGNAEYIEIAWNNAPDIARALIETQKQLDDARALAHQVLAEHRARGAVLTAACGSDESVRMAREWLASVEEKGDEEA